MRIVASLAAVALLAWQAEALVKIGSFRSHSHGVAGDVYAISEKKIVIKGFKYDGAGPDAFFWVGTEGEPSSVGTILPYPFQGKFYEYEDLSAPILTRAFTGEDIELTLPDGLKVSSLKWLSVWCRAYSVNFGDLIVPEDFSLETATAEAEAEPEQDELPSPVVNNNLDEKYDGDWDADAESEAEAESEPEAEVEAESEAEAEPNSIGGGASGIATSLLLTLAVPAFVKLF